MRLTALASLAILVFLSAPAMSQEPPARTGRLAYVEGVVSISPDADSGWEEGPPNMPLTTANSVKTDRNSRAEVRVSSTVIRLSDLTQVDLSRIDDDAIDATLAAGTVNVRVRYKQRDEHYTIATPQALFVIDGDGSYRIDYDAELDESRLTVTNGSAHMESESGDVVVEAGRSLRLLGGSDASYGIDRAAPDDDFDRWSRARDAGWRDAASRRYVSPYMTGYEDLDTNGQWSSDPDYGQVWMPLGMDPEWAPYRDGRWSFVRPWGWTWVDSSPWGYAPFHYGRWIFVRNRWAWCPGRRVERPVYAPALVAWIGSPNWTSAAPSSAAVGWYPLAPWDRYEPWFRASTAYSDRVNAVVRDRAPRDWKGPGEQWRNGNRDRATTVVSRDAFTGRRPVAQSRVSAEGLRREPVVAASQVANLLPRHDEVARTGRSTPAAANPALRSDSSQRERARDAQQVQQRAVRDAQQQREAQDHALQGNAPQQRDLRDAAQQQERAARDAHRDAQQDAQQEQQRDALRRTRELAQAQQRAARAAQEQQQRASHKALEQQQSATKQQGEQKERTQHDVQQQAREAQQAQREAQQQAQRSARDAQATPAPREPAPPSVPPGPAPSAPTHAPERDKDK